MITIDDGANASTRPAQAHILLVDDEQDILPEYQEFFEGLGYPTRTCADPLQALAIVLEEPDIGVVITDVRMANLDGISLIRQIRSTVPTGRKMEFIILTGDASSRMDDDMRDIPVFLKPAEIDVLIATINAAQARL